MQAGAAIQTLSRRFSLDGVIGGDFSFYRKKRKVPPLFILIDFKLAYFGSKTGDAFFVTLGNLVNFLDRRIDV